MAVIFRRKDNLKGSEAEVRIGIAIKRGYESLGDDLTRSIQNRLPVSNGGKFPRGLNRGRFKKGIKKRVSGKGLRTKLVIFNNVKHAKFVEEGREPGKKAPGTNAILPWVRQKGIGAKAFSIKTRRAISAGTKRSFDRKKGELRSRPQSLLQIQKGIAFVISRSIGKEGIKGLFLFKNLKSDYASKISAATTKIRGLIAQQLNS